MSITPLDIHQKKFKTAFKGYNVDDVDKFLDEISAQLDELFRENTAIKEKIAESDIIVNKYQGLEKAMNKALINAGKLADEITSKAGTDADKILVEAKKEAKKTLEALHDQRKDLLRNIKKLQRIDEKCRNRLLTTLDDFIKEINMAEPIIEENVLDVEDKVTARLEEYVQVNIENIDVVASEGENESEGVDINVDIKNDISQEPAKTSNDELVGENKTSIETSAGTKEDEKDVVSAFADLGEGVPGVIKRKRKQRAKQQS